jgi:hypothetical protein
MANTRPVMAAAASAMRKDMQEHYRNQPANKRGWPTRRFWQKEGASRTHIAEVTATKARVSVDSPAMAHKLTGGTIRPKRGRALALPVRAEAYRAGSPREGGIKDLVILKKKRAKKVWLGTVKDKVVTIYYRLVPQVTQRPDPRAFPGKRGATDAALAAMGRAIDALVRRGKT